MECRFIDQEGVTRKVVTLEDPIPRVYLTPVFTRPICAIYDEELPLTIPEIVWDLWGIVEEADGGPFAIYRRRSLW